MTNLTLGIEMYVRFAIDQEEFRFFAPITLESLSAATSVSSAVVNGTLRITHMADMVVNLGNETFVKNRSLETDITPALLRHIKSIPLTEYETVRDYVDQQFNPEVIGEFRGEYRFLSNFYPATFVYQSIIWLNSEAAYQAMKSRERDVHIMFSQFTSPVTAKHEGRLIDPIRSDWDEVKVNFMRDIVYEKFRQNPDLRQKLIATGNAVLQEGNTHNDQVWGICPPYYDRGENNLGKILMDVRRELKTISY